MNKDEALKMAIGFASVISETYSTGGEAEKVINACKEALEQPAPPAKTTSLEDVIKEFEKDPEMKALLDLARKQVRGMELKQPAQEPNCYGDGNVYRGLRSEDSKVKTYYVNTHPHQWQGLTDDEIAKLWKKFEMAEMDINDGAYRMALPIINACKEALEQPAQEPVAWMDKNNYVFEKESDIDSSGIKIPLYTHPHQWQGLTDNEIVEIHNQHIQDDNVFGFARAIEQALKEKNSV